MSNDDKKRLSYERQNAVRNAWKDEKTRVLNGYGTRKWSAEEQEELIQRGAVKGYEGHHMKSVSLYPEYAGNSNNIQFLTEDEHLYGAHNGSYHNLTNGYYDTETQTMKEFGDGLGEVPVYDLSNHENEESIDKARLEYCKMEEEENNLSNENDVQAIKDSIEKSEACQDNKSEGSPNEKNGISGGRR